MTRDDDRYVLLEVLRDTRVLLSRPDNDCVWSKWNTCAEALTEFDAFIDALDRDEPIDLTALRGLFLPTASIQEVSVSSGWGAQFLDLASRFDRAIGEA